MKEDAPASLGLTLRLSLTLVAANLLVVMAWSASCMEHAHDDGTAQASLCGMQGTGNLVLLAVPAGFVVIAGLLGETEPRVKSVTRLFLLGAVAAFAVIAIAASG